MHSIETLKRLNAERDRKVVNVVQDPENPVPAEVIASSIVEIAKAMKCLNDSRLKRKAIILLISSSSGVGRIDVANVLDALDQLEQEWCK